MTAIRVVGGDLTRALRQLMRQMDGDLGRVKQRAKTGAESKGQKRRRRMRLAAVRRHRAARRAQRRGEG